MHGVDPTYLAFRRFGTIVYLSPTDIAPTMLTMPLRLQYFNRYHSYSEPPVWLFGTIVEPINENGAVGVKFDYWQNWDWVDAGTYTWVDAGRLHLAV